MSSMPPGLASSPGHEAADAPPRASRLPATFAREGTLLLWFSTGRALGRAIAVLRAGRFGCDVHDGCVRIRLGGGSAPACLSALVHGLSPQEGAQTRALFVPGDDEPGFSHFGRVLSLRSLDVLARSGELIDQLAAGRFTCHFHPIVSARPPHEPFAYEALLRGIDLDGSLQPAEPLFALARAAGLLPELDALACRTAIRAAMACAPGLRLFINFAPAAIDDPHEHLAWVQRALAEAGLAKDRVVFEVVEADRFEDPAALEVVLAAYRSAGFRLALDDLGAGWSSLNLVHRLRPDFVKLDRELIEDVHEDPVKGAIARKLLELCTEVGITSIVEGVQTRAELEWVAGHGADYVQGFLFSRPAATPPTPPWRG
jgi:EAL domain-containing protein (putative c-di-GMP-specific phosphodiesterase class I)